MSTAINAHWLADQLKTAIYRATTSTPTQVEVDVMIWKALLDQQEDVKAFASRERVTLRIVGSATHHDIQP
jgi:hypothetical protein